MLSLKDQEAKVWGTYARTDGKDASLMSHTDAGINDVC